MRTASSLLVLYTKSGKYIYKKGSFGEDCLALYSWIIICIKQFDYIYIYIKVGLHGIGEGCLVTRAEYVK